MIENHISTYSNTIAIVLEVNSQAEGKTVVSPIGTAFLCHEDGYFLTCSHIINLTKTYYLLPAKNINEFNYISLDEYLQSSFEVLVKQYNPINDVALLEIKDKGNLTITMDIRNIGRPLPVNVGESVYYMGFPFLNLGLYNLTVSNSIISSKIKLTNGTNQYQIDSMVHEGNSGGPLIDLISNKIIGIISGTFDPQAKGGGINIISNGRTHKEGTTISYTIPIEYGIELLKAEGKI